MSIYSEGNLDPARHRGQPGHPLPGLQCVGAGVVGDRAQGGVGAGKPVSLLRAGEGGLQRFRRLHLHRDHQLRREVRELLPDASRREHLEAVVGGVVQPHAVLLPLRPTIGRDGIEALSVLAQCLQEHASLLRCWIQPKPDRSLHTHMLQYLAKGGKVVLLPRPKARGLRAAVHG